MKTRFLVLNAAALLVAACTAHAAITETQRYADKVRSRVEALARVARLDLEGHSVSVRARFDIDGRVTGMEMARGSGSHDVDLAVEALLRKVVTRDPPCGLTDDAVFMTVTAAPEVEAQAR